MIKNNFYDNYNLVYSDTIDNLQNYILLSAFPLFDLLTICCISECTCSTSALGHRDNLHRARRARTPCATATRRSVTSEGTKCMSISLRIMKGAKDNARSKDYKMYIK